MSGKGPGKGATPQGGGSLLARLRNKRAQAAMPGPHGQPAPCASSDFTGNDNANGAAAPDALSDGQASRVSVRQPVAKRARITSPPDAEVCSPDKTDDRVVEIKRLPMHTDASGEASCGAGASMGGAFDGNTNDSGCEGGDTSSGKRYPIPEPYASQISASQAHARASQRPQKHNGAVAANANGALGGRPMPAAAPPRPLDGTAFFGSQGLLRNEEHRNRCTGRDGARRVAAAKAAAPAEQRPREADVFVE